MSSAPAMGGSFSPHYQNRGKIQPPFSRMSGNYMKAPERFPFSFYPRNIPISPRTVNSADRARDFPWSHAMHILGKIEDREDTR